MNEASLTATQAQGAEWRYAPVEGYWDEAVRPSGFPRRPWRKLAAAMQRMGSREFDRYWKIGQQVIQDKGITYNVVSDPQGNERPWPMDPIPLILPENEWAEIECGVIQRATLLNALLADFYGKQRLLYDQHLPPALVFANPQFLRPCVGITPPGGAHLLTYAADLARSPDGRWWVICDRTQAPSGMGYTLENRLVSARTLPQVFSQYRVQQLARFFDARRNALLAQAAQHSNNPRVVVLTPGPHSETYFEHSFLAGYWGFALVEGADLIVRDNRVYLKTLAGLEPVDLILRRLDDSYCDPLELRGDSLLGVPGLVQAARTGTVAIDNALGSGLAESPALMAFLPGLCRQLLGEDLKMPSVATWWCGQEKPRQYVLEHFDQLAIVRTFTGVGQQAKIPCRMDASAREELLAKIQAQPDQYVAQEGVLLSTAPVHTDTGLAPLHVVLRVFAAWDGQSYTVMRGGLTRVSTESNSQAVSMQLGGSSKDTWVLGNLEDAAAAPSAPPVSIYSPPANASLPSRVADNLFWMGRYTERVEANARLLRSLLPALSAEEDFGRGISMQTALHLLVGLRYLPPEVSGASLGEQRWRVQRLLTELVYDPSQISSLGWNLREMRRAAWHLKERLSADTWRVLQQLEAEFSRVLPFSPDHRYMAQMGVLDAAVVTLAALSGLLMENTTRGYGWRFLEMGRRLERALQIIDLLRCGIVDAPAELEPYLQVLLQVADSAITYRTRYLSVVRTDLVLHLLLADESNPRSVGFQLSVLAHELTQLREFEGSDRHLLGGLALRALGAVRVALAEELAARDNQGHFTALADLLQQLKRDLYFFSDALADQYLSHLKASRLTSSW